MLYNIFSHYTQVWKVLHLDLLQYSQIARCDVSKSAKITKNTRKSRFWRRLPPAQATVTLYYWCGTVRHIGVCQDQAPDRTQPILHTSNPLIVKEGQIRVDAEWDLSVLSQWLRVVLTFCGPVFERNPMVSRIKYAKYIHKLNSTLACLIDQMSMHRLERTLQQTLIKLHAKTLSKTQRKNSHRRGFLVCEKLRSTIRANNTQWCFADSHRTDFKFKLYALRGKSLKIIHFIDTSARYHVAVQPRAVHAHRSMLGSAVSTA